MATSLARIKWFLSPVSIPVDASMPEPVIPEPWENPKNGSTLGLDNLHCGAIRVQNWGVCFLDPTRLWVPNFFTASRVGRRIL